MFCRCPIRCIYSFFILGKSVPEELSSESDRLTLEAIAINRQETLQGKHIYIGVAFYHYIQWKWCCFWYGIVYKQYVQLPFKLGNYMWLLLLFSSDAFHI